MPSVFRSFAARIGHMARDESGAVTVDWVVLTAALVGIVLTLFTWLTNALYSDAGVAIASQIDAAVDDF